MNWEGRAYCLNSTSVVGYATSLDLLQTVCSMSPGILVAEHLTPIELVPLLEAGRIAGVVLRHGSLVDHTAGRLNGAGLPLVIVANLPLVPHNTPLLIDGINEQVVISKDVKVLQARLGSLGARQPISIASSALLEYRGEPVSVHVDGNTADELLAGIKYGAQGVGILRTEWLGWSGTTCPDVKTHHKLYADCAAHAYPYTVNIRLFDIGGDKIPKWASDATERVQSPLGDRGVRAFSSLPKVFMQQLKAICEVAQERPLGIVVPMTTDVSDILRVKQRLADMTDEGVLRNIQFGAMIEVPAAAVEINHILPEVDFVRIGPGDLSQFTLAKERCNISPIEFSGSAMHAAVLKLIQHVTDECQTMGKPVSLCLDLEPRTALLRTLLSAGVRTFCVAPSNIQITVERLIVASRE